MLFSCEQLSKKKNDTIKNQSSHTLKISVTDSSIQFRYDSLLSVSKLETENYACFTEIFKDSIAYNLRYNRDMRFVNDLSASDFSNVLSFKKENSFVHCKIISMQKNGNIPLYFLKKINNDTIYIDNFFYITNANEYSYFLGKSHPLASLLYYESTIRFSLPQSIKSPVLILGLDRDRDKVDQIETE